VLGAAACRELAEEARSIGLEVLLEIHTDEELDAYSPFINVLGINNRNLRTFVTDPAESERLFPLLPKNVLAISESGLLKAETARRLKEVGYAGFLIGEAFMRSEEPAVPLREYIQTLIS